MQDKNYGLTVLYNKFHNPEVDNAEIVELRRLHATLDRAVLNAYGWTDIQPNCEFIPEFDGEGGEDYNGHVNGTKYRYRWPDEVHDEVLARLLELNRQRAEEESLAGAAADSAKPKKRAQKKSAKVSLPAPTLFSAEDPSK
jgi:hypothetical protein